ncbi:MAG: hypothetical protein NVSMB19_15780 [Vulcanimicrobiaceae bacterium]
MLDTSAPTIRYTFAELERLWINAGGSAIAAPIAAAIAEAESAGVSNNLNPRDSNGKPSRGLWQINGSNFQPGTDGTEFYDARVNASKAVELWRGRGATLTSFQDWGTFTSGAYARFLNRVTPPAPTALGSKTADGSGLSRDHKGGDPLVNANVAAASGAVAAVTGGFASWQPWLETQIFQLGAITIGLAILAAVTAPEAAATFAFTSGSPPL